MPKSDPPYKNTHKIIGETHDERKGEQENTFFKTPLHHHGRVQETDKTSASDQAIGQNCSRVF